MPRNKKLHRNESIDLGTIYLGERIVAFMKSQYGSDDADAIIAKMCRRGKNVGEIDGVFFST